MYPYGFKEDLIVRFKLHFSEKVILCTEDTSATFKLSDISLEYDAIFDEPYATTIGEMYTQTTSTSYTKVTLIHYQTLSKKDATWKIKGNNFLFIYCKAYCDCYLINVMTLPTKMKIFTTQASRKFLTSINGNNQLFAAG